MSQVRIVILIALTVLVSPAEAESVLTVSEGAVKTCFEARERLERLACYDRVLQRPMTEDVVLPPPAPTVSQARAAAEADLKTVLSTPWQSDDGVLITLQSHDNGDILHDPFTLLAEAKTRPDKLPADLYLALRSDPATGVAATLVLSCRNAITELQIYWPETLSGTVADVRLYYGRSLNDPADHEDRRFKVRGDGILLENARGLDSIRLARMLAGTAITQVSVGSGTDVRSAFFETVRFEPVLGLIGQQCAWSNP
jgi:type VI secretion system VasI family protein